VAKSQTSTEQAGAVLTRHSYLEAVSDPLHLATMKMLHIEAAQTQDQSGLGLAPAVAVLREYGTQKLSDIQLEISVCVIQF
jgi:hypothetical protein